MQASQTIQIDSANADDGFIRKYWQLIIMAVALIWVNRSLFGGGINTDLVFFSQAVGEGQWWRVATYPLVHISWYHLLLDGGAFLVLFHSLDDQGLLSRLACVTGAAIGSLALALMLEPSIHYRGLCGLSGVAHGLMAVTGLEMLFGRRHRLLGLVTFLLVVSKSAWEMWTGQVMFAAMHLGEYGTPLVACHGGGVLGAMLVYGVVRLRRRRQRQALKKEEADS